MSQPLIPQLCLVTFVSHIAQIIKLQWQIGIWAVWLTNKSNPGLAFQTTSFLHSFLFSSFDNWWCLFLILPYVLSFHIHYKLNVFMISTSQWIIYFAVCWYCENQWTSKIDSTSDLPSPKRIFQFKIVFSHTEHKLCSSFFVNLCHQILDRLYFHVPNLLVCQWHPYIWVYSSLALFPNSHCSSLAWTTTSFKLNLHFILHFQWAFSQSLQTFKIYRTAWHTPFFPLHLKPIFKNLFFFSVAYDFLALVTDKYQLSLLSFHSLA